MYIRWDLFRDFKYGHEMNEVKDLQTLMTLFKLQLQWSLYFKTTHGTKKMSYIAGGLKIKVI